MAKENTVLTIDIGGDSLKMAEFSFPSGGGMTLEKFAFAEYDIDLKEAGFVLNANGKLPKLAGWFTEMQANEVVRKTIIRRPGAANMFSIKICCNIVLT